MNVVVISGNLVRDPEKRATQNGVSVCNFTVAVQRRVKDASGQYPADFINCVSWDMTADFVAKHFLKGQPIEVRGNIQTRKYTAKNGDERHVTEVIAEEVHFCGKKQDNVGRVQEDISLDDIGTPLNEEDLPF